MDPRRLVTTDPASIRVWAEKLGGKPQRITAQGVDIPAGLRIDFPGDQDDQGFGFARVPENITWDVFFDEMDRQGLALSYLDTPKRTDSASLSDSYMFVKRGQIAGDDLEDSQNELLQWYR